MNPSNQAAQNMNRANRPKIKFCGLKREEDIEFANALLPDFVGFIFAKSPRFIDFESARILAKKLDSRIKKVGVFVNESAANIAKIAPSLDFIQLHGSEDSRFIDEIRAQSSAKIIRAIRVKSADSILESLLIHADFVLLDNKNAGSGERFEWQMLESALKREDFKAQFSEKYFLAGGLNSQNIAHAARFAPFALDISSGIETNGAKDFAKMRDIILKIRKNA